MKTILASLFLVGCVQTAHARDITIMLRDNLAGNSQTDSMNAVFFTLAGVEGPFDSHFMLSCQRWSETAYWRIVLPSKVIAADIPAGEFVTKIQAPTYIDADGKEFTISATVYETEDKDGYMFSAEVPLKDAGNVADALAPGKHVRIGLGSNRSIFVWGAQASDQNMNALALFKADCARFAR